MHEVIIKLPFLCDAISTRLHRLLLGSYLSGLKVSAQLERRPTIFKTVKRRNIYGNRPNSRATVVSAIGLTFQVARPFAEAVTITFSTFKMVTRKMVTTPCWLKHTILKIKLGLTAFNNWDVIILVPHKHRLSPLCLNRHLPLLYLNRHLPVRCTIWIRMVSKSTLWWLVYTFYRDSMPKITSPFTCIIRPRLLIVTKSTWIEG